jgi:MFS family permease
MYILFPKKLVYIVFVFIFKVGNLVCASAPSSAVLIAGRAVSGAGASGVFAGGFAILTAIVPLHKRPIYMGTISSTFAHASIVGPVISGALTEHLSWRWCFYINPPCGAFAVFLLFFLFRVKTVRTKKAPLVDKLKGLDGIGLLLFSARQQCYS